MFYKILIQNVTQKEIIFAHLINCVDYNKISCNICIENVDNINYSLMKTYN